MNIQEEEKVDITEISDIIKADVQQQLKQAVDSQKDESSIATHLKRFMDNKYGPNWHCIVGKSFNGYMSYESKHFMFVYEGHQAVVLYKMG